jgi:L-lactate permease
MFSQLLTPVQDSLGLSFLVAVLPIVTVLVLLGLLRLSAWIAAAMGLAVASAIAVFVWQMPINLALNSVANGAVFALWPVMWIVANALLLYNVAVRSTRFDAFRNWVADYLPNDRRVVLVVVGFCFGALLEGISGFGTPVAITSSLLILVGYPPLEALVFVLIFNTAPVAFGALGVPVTVLGAVTGLPAAKLGAMVGRQLPIIAVILPFYVMALYGGWRSVRALWPVLLVSGGSFGLSQFVSSNFIDYTLTDVLSSLGSLIATLLFLQIWRPSEDPEFRLAHGVAKEGGPAQGAIAAGGNSAYTTAALACGILAGVISLVNGTLINQAGLVAGSVQLQAAGFAIPALAIAGGAISKANALLGSFLMALSAVVLVFVLGTNATTAIPLILAAVGSLLALASTSGRSPVPHWQGWLPWLIVSATVIVWTTFKVAGIGEQKIAWPGLDKAISITLYGGKPYGAIWTFQPLGTGTAILLAAVITAIAVRLPLRTFFACIGDTVRQVWLPTVTVMLIIGVAYLMNYSGLAYTLGKGVSETGQFFVLLSPFLGWIAVMLSGSDTSGNALFGNLQVVAARQLNLDPTLFAATNSSGGVMGKMISPQNIATGVSVTKLAGHEGVVFARTFIHSIVLTLLLGLLVAAQQYLIPWVIPK